MKISLDGGALCSNENLHFGNYTFTQNLIDAVHEYDKDNDYTVYTFCQKPDWLRTNKKIHYKILKPRILWLSTRVSIEEVARRKDIFLALNQAIPTTTRSQIISFSLGLSYYFYPQFYTDSYYALKDHLDPMIKRSRYIVVLSRRVKLEMQKLFPNFNNFKILNPGVPMDMLNYVPVKRNKCFLFVGMNNQIKNISFLLKVFNEFRKKKEFYDYKLFLVGNLKEFEDEDNGILCFPNSNRDEIKKLYSEAAAYLTASFYESFNFPVLEALAQNCPVIGLDDAIIPEFKEFVNLAYGSDDFLKLMIAICQKDTIRTNREEILKRFSWKKYISKLKELYIGTDI